MHSLFKYVLVLGLIASIVVVISLVIPMFGPCPGCSRIKNTLLIDENEDFEKNSFSGQGLVNDPYVIENIVFGEENSRIKDYYIGLEIRDTSKYFVVKNCTFYGGKVGLLLSSIAEGTGRIQDSFFYTIPQTTWDHYVPMGGLMIEDSDSINISNNSIIGSSCFYDYDCAGLTLVNSDKCIIEDNYLESPSAIIESDNNTLRDNIIKDDVMLENSLNSLLEYNQFDSEFLTLDYSPYTLIKNNKLSKFIFITSSNHVLFSGNSLNLLTINNCDSNLFFNNSFEGYHGYGVIEFSQMNNFTFSNNNLTNGEIGLRLSQCNFSIIEANSFYYCSNYAIDIDGFTSNTLIYHNSFIQNNALGTSQAIDNGNHNEWFNLSLLEGNYWDNLGSNSTYEIDGSAGSVDLYPLSSSI